MPTRTYSRGFSPLQATFVVPLDATIGFSHEEILVIGCYVAIIRAGLGEFPHGVSFRVISNYLIFRGQDINDTAQGVDFFGPYDLVDVYTGFLWSCRPFSFGYVPSFSRLFLTGNGRLGRL